MKLIERIKRFINRIKADFQNFSRSNDSEQAVLAANYFSAYKGTFVVKLPIGTNAASYGMMMIGNKVTSIQTVKHEFGHKMQLRERGILNYTFQIAIPSLTANLLDRWGKLPYDYYGSAWESEADTLGDVKRSVNNRLWPEDAYHSYKDLLKLLFKKKMV